MKLSLGLLWYPFPMRAWPLGAILVLLAACARVEGPPPRLALVEPAGGGVTPGREVEVRGYAFSPIGVRSVRAQGEEVLPPGEVGKRLAEFRFKLRSPSSGQVEVRLEAQDLQGGTSTLSVPLFLDAEPPRIRVERVTIEDGIRRAYGFIEDNVAVDRVALQVGGRYTPLALPREKRVAFAVEAPRGALLIAVDAAGNRASRGL